MDTCNMWLLNYITYICNNLLGTNINTIARKIMKNNGIIFDALLPKKYVFARSLGFLQSLI